MAAVREGTDDVASPTGESLGPLFSASGETRLDVQAGDETVITSARWARLAAGDPHRVIAGSEQGACEVLLDAEGEPTAVHRLDGTRRWQEFGNPSPGIGVLEPLYVPTRPEYAAKKHRVEAAADDPRPGGLFAWDATRVVDERADAGESCDFCDENPAVVRTRAWREDVVFGIGRTREEVVNRECWRCLDADPDAEDVLAYRSPDEDVEFPIEFDDSTDTTGEWEALDPEAVPDHPDEEPVAVLWTRDGLLDGLFSVYERDSSDDGRAEYLLIAVLHHDGEPVGAETATLHAEGAEDVLSQARKIYASFWSTSDREIDWDSLIRVD